jgi:Na+-driven multidrug efflux pump
VHELGVEYFEVNALTFLSQLLLIVFANSLRAAGDFKTPMKFVSISVLINVALDPILIFGWGPIPAYGLAGAAWATVIAQVVGVSLYVLRFSRRSGGPRRLYWTKPLLSRTVFQDLASRGLPAGLQFFLISGVLAIVLGAMKPYGSTWTATAGGGFRVFQQALLPLVALAAGAASIAGQNLGAGQIARIREVTLLALRWAVIYGAVGWILIHLAGGVLGHLFLKDETVLWMAELYFAWTAPGLVAFALVLISMYVLQACGRSVLPLLAALAKLVVLSVLVYMVIPALELGPAWVFGASMVANFVEGIGGLLFTLLMLRELQESPPKI